MGLGERFGITNRVNHLVMPAVERSLVLGEHSPDNPDGFVEGLEAAGNRFEVDPETAMLQFEPSCAKPQVQAPAADDIERRRHLRDHAWVPVSVAVDKRADSGTAGVLAKGGQQCPSFHAGSGRVRHEDRVEVVEDPERVVAPLVGVAPQLGHFVPSDVLLSGLNAKTDRMLRRHSAHLLICPIE
jgi:hypothetical protein